MRAQRILLAIALFAIKMKQLQDLMANERIEDGSLHHFGYFLNWMHASPMAHCVASGKRRGLYEFHAQKEDTKSG